MFRFKFSNSIFFYVESQNSWQ